MKYSVSICFSRASLLISLPFIIAHSALAAESAQPVTSAAATTVPVNPSVVWGEPLPSTPHAPTHNQTASPSGEALSVLFNQSRVVVDGPNAQLKNTFILNLNLPYTLDGAKTLKSVVSDVRGSVSKSEGARVYLLCDIEGITRTFKWSYGKKVDSDEFVKSIKASKSPKDQKTYSASIFVIVERKTLEDHATFDLDSLDIELFTKK